jgi:RHS repeat-associated protein
MTRGRRCSAGTHGVQRCHAGVEVPARLWRREPTQASARSALPSARSALPSARSVLLFLLIGITLVLGHTQQAQAASACTVTWTGKVDNTWGTARNWSPTRIPTSRDWVCIAASGAHRPVLLASPTTATVRGFANAGGLTVQGSLTATEAANPSSSSGALTISGGSLADAGGLSVSGAMAWSGGSLSGRGTTTVAGGDTLTIHNQANLIRSALVIAGAAVLSDNSGLSLSQYASVTNDGSFTAQGLATGSTIYGDNGASSTTFTNNGTFTKTGSGRVSLGYGLVLEENKALALSAGTLSIGPGSGGDELAFQPGSSVSGTGLLEVSGGTVTANTPTTIPNLSMTGGTIQPLAGLTVSGTMAWSSGNQLGRGTTTVAPGASLTITGFAQVQTGDLLLRGSTVLSDNSTLSLSQGAIVTNEGSFTTQALANGNDISGDTIPGNTFVNDGTFTKTGSGRTTVGANVTLVDNKLLALNAGTFTLGPNSNGGELAFDAGSSVSGTGLLQLESGTLAVNTPTTIANLSLSGGTVRPVAGLTVSGALAWSNGSQSGRGTTTVAPGASLTITGSAQVQTGDLLLRGSTVLSDNSTLSLSQGAIVTNEGSFTTQALANGNNISADNSPGTRFVNNGTFTKAGLGRTTLTSGLVLEENRALTLGAGTLTSGPPGPVSTLNFNPGSSVSGAGLLEMGSGGRLVANAPITIPELSLTGGTVYPAAGLTVSGTMDWSGGTLFGPGTTTIAAGASLAITGNASVDLGDLLLEGSTVLSDNSTLSLTQGAIATNNGSFTAQALANGNSLTGDGSGVLVNNGTFTKSDNGHTSLIGLTMINAKSLTLNAGTFIIGPSGPGGILELDAGGSIGGGALLELGSGRIVANVSTTIPNLSLAGGTLYLTPGAALTVGQWSATSGTVETEIASRSAYGSLHTTQPVDLSAIRLEIETIGSYLPQYHDTLHILTAGSLTGPFASVGGETFDETWTWAQAYSTSTASLIAVPPIPAAISAGQTFGGPGGLDSINPSGYWGEPVNSATGAFWTEQTDARLGGLGIPFQFTRYYTSADTQEGPLGPGWSDSLSASLSVSGATVVLSSENGQLTTYTEQPDGTYLGSPGVRSVLVKSGAGWLLTRPDQTRLSFDSSGHLTSLRDRNQIGLALTYNASGQLSKVTDHAGRVVTFTYSASNRLTSMSFPPGRTVHYAYDTSNRLATVTDAAGGITHYTYDESSGLLTTIKDPDAHTEVANTYDSSGRVIKQIDAAGHVSTFSWNPATQTATLTDPRGKQWQDVYSGNLLQQQIDPLGDTNSYIYDSHDNLIARTSPRGATTTMAYDERGNLVAATAPAPLSYTQSWTYDQFDDVIAHSDGRGLTTHYAYDAKGNLLSGTAPDGAKTTYARDPITGAVVSSTNPLTHTTSYSYDSAGDLIKMTSPLNEITTYGYDAAGRRTAMVDPRGNVSGGTPSAHQTTTAYNALDQVVGVTDPAGHTTATAYDATGNLLTRTDANGHTTSYAYDADNRLTKVTAPDGSTTLYAYDGDGNRVSRTDGNSHTTTWAYDNANRLASMTTSLGHTTTYSYNGDGARTKTADPVGATTTTTYDSLDRPTSVTYSDGTPSVTYAYNPDSQRTSMTDGGGTIAYTYDNNGRLTKTSRGTSVFSYTYNLGDQLLTRTLPDATTTTNTYDADGRLATVSAGAATTTYSYDVASEPIKTVLPGGVVESRTWEATGWPATIKALSGEKTLDSFAYSYNPAGNPTQVITPAGTTTYAYDARDRIASCTGPSCTGGSTSWAYNAVNLTKQTTPAGTTTYAYDADNQLSTATGPGAASTTYHYDLDGRRTAAGANTYTWNASNELTGATVAGVTSAYAYDGDGLRLTSTVGGQMLSDAWDVNNEVPQLALEQSSGSALVRRYTYGLGPVGMTTPSGSYYYQHDSLQGIAGVTDSSGAAQWAYSYAPYGTTTPTKLSPSAPANPIGYAGQYLDATGLYNLRARQLDPLTGQFLSPDPLQPSVQAPYNSTYAYAADRPTVLVDPTGLCAQETSSWCAEEARMNHYVSVYMHNFNLVRGVAQGALPSGGQAVGGWATDVFSSAGMPSVISGPLSIFGPIYQGFEALKTVFNAFTAASNFESY